MSEPKHPRLVAAVILAALTVIAFGYSVGGDFLNWDDPTYVQDNHELRSAEGLVSIFSSFHFANYNPLHRLTYWVEWQCFGGNATAFRLTNLLLHVGNVLLLFGLLRTWRTGYWVALAATAWFAVHPANVETVAWISERKTLLATGFAFASILCWLRGARPAAWLLFTTGMFCKTSIVVVPILLVAIDLAQREDWRQRAKWYAAFLVPSIALGITQIFAAAANDAVRPLHGGSLATHVATIVAVLPSYLGNLVLPFGLTPRHPFEPATLSDPRFLFGLLTLGAVAYGIVRSWRGQRRFAVAALWCLAALYVTLIVPIPILLADRYLYFAMPLLLAVGVEWVARFQAETRAGGEHDPTTGLARPALLGFGVLVIALTGATFSYAGKWRDSTSLWTHALEQHPTDVDAWISFGAARHTAGDNQGSLKAYAQALELAPTHADAIESMAGVELAEGRLDSAQERLEQLLDDQPTRGKARAMLAASFDLAGNPTRARREFERGLKQAPDDFGLLFNYVNFCERNRKQQDARRALTAFVRKNPGHTAARNALFRLSAAAPGR